MATNYVMRLVLVETVKHLELVVLKCSTLPGASGHYVKYFIQGWWWLQTIDVMGLVLVETVKHLELVVLKCSTFPGAGGHYVKIFYTGLVVATNYVMGLVLVETSQTSGAGGHQM